MPRHLDLVNANVRRRRADVNRTLMMALFARMDALALAFAMGVVIALGLFFATTVLILKGAPPGAQVGPNLAALQTFLPGYRVTWQGGLLGAGYGFLIGGAVGFVLAVMWNFAHIIFIGFAVLKGNWLD